MAASGLTKRLTEQRVPIVKQKALAKQEATDGELSAQKMSLDYPLCAGQAAFSIVT